MKKILFGILIGVAIAFLFLSTKNPGPIKPAQVNQDPVESHPAAPQPEILPVDKKAEAPAIPTSSTLAQAKSNPSEPTPAQLLNLDISEAQIAEIEENLSDLQKEVSFFRDNSGWIVRFHTESNLLSQIGMKDNDLIRFGQIEKLKEDPSKTALISRLEAVIETLRR